MTVLVAPDKFKGSLTALEVATAIGEGLEAAGVASRLLPLADGGDGSVAAALHAGSTTRPVGVRGADGRRHETVFAFDGTTAVVEVASTCGLSTLPPGVLAPMTSSSYGFGQAVLAAVDAGARCIVLCLGGSASTDGGAGLLAALGVRFRDDAGRDVEPAGGTLARITEVDVSGLRALDSAELVVAADVTNPLLGPDGAAAVFGPQKGASPLQVADLEAGLAHLARLLTRHRPAHGRDSATETEVFGHVEVDGLGAVQDVGLVEDADVAVVSDPPVELPPGGQVGVVPGAGVAIEVFGAAPVLDGEHRASADVGAVGEQAEVGTRGQFLEHPGHRRGDRQPLPDLPQPVDPHADEEGDRPGRCVGGHPAGECCPAHRDSPVGGASDGI